MLSPTQRIQSETPGVRGVNPNAKIALTSYGAGSYSQSRLTNFPAPYSDQWARGTFDPTLVDQMLCHPKIYQNFNLWKSKVIGDGGRAIPCVPPSDPNYEVAKQYADFCNWNLRNIKGSWYVLARQFLDAGMRHAKIAPITCRDQEWGIYTGRRVLDYIPVWPNWGGYLGSTYQFMQDKYGEFTAIRLNGGKQRDITRNKFAVYTFRPENNNPYGTTFVPALAEPFYKSVQANPELMAYVAQFGRPTVYAIAPESKDGVPIEDVTLYHVGTDEPVRDEDGEIKKVSPMKAMELGLQNYSAGTVVTLPGGAVIGLLQAAAGGEGVFRQMEESNDRAFASVFLGTYQYTESPRSVGEGNAGASEAAVGVGITDGKRGLEEMVENDLFRLIIELNYGMEGLDLLPIYDVGSQANPRLAQMLNAFAGLVHNGAADEDQYFYFCVQSGLPLPNPKAKKVVMPGEVRGVGGNPGMKDNA